MDSADALDVNAWAPTRHLIGRIKGVVATVSLISLLFLVLPHDGALVRRTSVFALALPSVALIFLGSRPSRPRTIAALLTACAIFLLFVRACSTGMETLIFAGASLGIGAFLLLAVGALANQATGPAPFAPFGAALVLLTFSSAVGIFFKATVALSPMTYDIPLYLFDQKMGVQISFLTGQLFAAVPLLYAVAHTAYILLAPSIGALYAARLAKRSAHGGIIVPFAIAAVAGWIFYLVYPAAGPVYAFGNLFPFHPPSISALQGLTLAVPDAPRNCMPSLHTAWALLIFWNARGCGFAVRLLSAVFLTLTLLATLGLGEHYAIDLVVAVPFATAVQAVSSTSIAWKESRRLIPVATGISLTLAWIIALKMNLVTFLSSPALCWALIAVTVCLPMLFEKRLASLVFGETTDSKVNALQGSPRVLASLTPAADC